MLVLLSLNERESPPLKCTTGASLLPSLPLKAQERTQRTGWQGGYIQIVYYILIIIHGH